MRWRDYLTVMAGLLFIGWLRTVWAPSAEVATAGFVTIVLIVAIARRILRRHRFRRLADLAEAEREVAIDAFPAADAALARVGFEISFQPRSIETLPPERSFAYRAGSRSLTTYLFWACSLTAGAILIPLALGRFDEPSTAWVWAVLAALLLLSGLGYRQIAKELGGTLIVDRQGLAIEGTERDDRRLGWLEIAWVRPFALPGGVYRAFIIGNQLGQQIVLDTQIPQFNEVVELVAAKLVATRAAT
jgi:hypothetical protein